MTQDPSTLYKLIILYILKEAKYPLTNSQVSEYVVGKGYTDFLTFQLSISELSETELITADKKQNRTYLSLTEEGLNTLECLKYRISSLIKEDIQTYLWQNQGTLSNDNAIQSKVTELDENRFSVELTASDGQDEIISIKLNVPSKTIADNICNNWNEKNQDLYIKITQELF